MAALRVLCLDIEGGFGGSSRSLYESIRHMDRTQATIEVWCRRDGPVVVRYAALGVPCRVEPDIAHWSALPRVSRNLVSFPSYLRRHAASGPFRRRLAREVNARFDRVHFNHESLFGLASWLRGRTARPFTMHVRTNLWPSPFARWQVRSLSRDIDAFAFITANEEKTFRRLGGVPRAGAVIHNIVAPPDVAPMPLAELAGEPRFKVACISAYSWMRGLDRLLDVAEELERMGRRDVLFVMAGRMTLTRSLPGLLGEIGRRGGTLADAAETRGLARYFRFLGHVTEPECVLVACDALAKPTREDNPWGRDILEAMAMGLPVLSVGTDATFVETGVTGVLHSPFDGAALAREIARLADDRDSARRMGTAARARVAQLCDGSARARDLLALWRDAARPT
jgi:glycosyltransferase involved in cell wall biosynthesis